MRITKRGSLLELRSSSLPCVALGAFVTLFGGGMSWLALTGRLSTESGDRAVLVPALMGAGLLSLGLALATGRSGRSFDAQARKLRSWWGTLGMRFDKELPLAVYTEVRLNRELQRGQKSSRTVFPEGRDVDGVVRVRHGDQAVPLVQRRGRHEPR